MNSAEQDRLVARPAARAERPGERDEHGQDPDPDRVRTDRPEAVREQPVMERGADLPRHEWCETNDPSQTRPRTITLPRRSARAVSTSRSAAARAREPASAKASGDAAARESTASSERTSGRDHERAEGEGRGRPRPDERAPARRATPPAPTRSRRAVPGSACRRTRRRASRRPRWRRRCGDARHEQPRQPVGREEGRRDRRSVQVLRSGVGLRGGAEPPGRREEVGVQGMERGRVAAQLRAAGVAPLRARARPIAARR